MNAENLFLMGFWIGGLAGLVCTGLAFWLAQTRLDADRERSLARLKRVKLEVAQENARAFGRLAALPPEEAFLRCGQLLATVDERVQAAWVAAGKEGEKT